MNLYYLLDENKWEERMADGFSYSPAFLPGILAGLGACAKPVTEDGIPFLTKDDLLLIGADILTTVPENVGALVLLGGLTGAEFREENDNTQENGENAGKPGEEKNPVTNLADCSGDCTSCGGSCGDDENSGPDPKVYEILLRTRPRGEIRARYMMQSEMVPLPVPILPAAGSFQPMRMAVSIDKNGFESSMPALLWRGDLFFDIRFDVAMALDFADRIGDAKVKEAILGDFVRVLRMCGVPLFYQEMHAAKAAFVPADVRDITVFRKKNLYRISTKKDVCLRVPGSPAKAYLDGARTALETCEIAGEEAKIVRIPAGQHRVSWE